MSALSSPEAERSILGGILLNNEAYFEAAPVLRAEDFSLSSNRTIFGRMVALSTSGKPIDMRLLIEALESAKELHSVGGVGYVSDLVEGVPDRKSILHYARIVRDRARRRRLRASLDSLIAGTEDGSVTLDELLRQNQEALLSIEADSGHKSARHVKDIMPGVLQELQQQAACSGLVGFSTGTHALDAMTGGIRRGELWTFGALPGKGKTAIAVQIVLANANAGVPVMPFSIEMSETEIGKRMLVASGPVGASQMRNPSMISQEEWRGLTRSAGELGEMPIFVDDRGTLQIEQLVSSARLFIRKYGVALVLVDYLQIIRAPGKELRERVAYASNALRQLAKSENVAVVQLSQLARPKNINDRPTMIQLKESGDVEAHSHVIVLPHLPVDDQGELLPEEQWLIVAKNRNGGVGQVAVYFDSKTLQFKPRTTRAQ